MRRLGRETGDTLAGKERRTGLKDRKHLREEIGDTLTGRQKTPWRGESVQLVRVTRDTLIRR
jgi:hypothetical protein